jgi:hypothetical protein
MEHNSYMQEDKVKKLYVTAFSSLEKREHAIESPQ